MWPSPFFFFFLFFFKGDTFLTKKRLQTFYQCRSEISKSMRCLLAAQLSLYPPTPPRTLSLISMVWLTLITENYKGADSSIVLAEDEGLYTINPENISTRQGKKKKKKREGGLSGSCVNLPPNKAAGLCFVFSKEASVKCQRQSFTHSPAEESELKKHNAGFKNPNAWLRQTTLFKGEKGRKKKLWVQIAPPPQTKEI